jgi:hypothetical protein
MWTHYMSGAVSSVPYAVLSRREPLGSARRLGATGSTAV